MRYDEKDVTDTLPSTFDEQVAKWVIGEMKHYTPNGWLYNEATILRQLQEKWAACDTLRHERRLIAARLDIINRKGLPFGCL